jgi:hypothetical protein
MKGLASWRRRKQPTFRVTIQRSRRATEATRAAGRRRPELEWRVPQGKAA